MDKIDRLGWAAGVAFVSYGLRVGIRVSSPEIMDRIAELLPPNAKEARGPRVGCLYSLIVSGTKVGSNTRRFNILYSDSVQLARTKDTDVVLEALERDLQLYVAEQARRRVFVHAGVVGWRGRAIVIPGCTMSGKTTLVKALVEAGATYYSDEYAVLDERGRMHPYLKPLSVREDGAAARRRFSRRLWAARAASNRFGSGWWSRPTTERVQAGDPANSCRGRPSWRLWPIPSRYGTSRNAR